MTPCKKCDKKDSDDGFSLTCEIGWYDGEYERGFRYRIRCEKCGKHCHPAPTKRLAWIAWEMDNEVS